MTHVLLKITAPRTALPGLVAVERSGALGCHERMKATTCRRSSSVNGPPWAWLHAGICVLGTPELAMLKMVPSSVVLRNCLLLSDGPSSEPSPFSPWQVAQFLVKIVWPAVTAAAVLRASSAA